MDTMILIGADDVRAGGAAASHAGAEMKQAAATIDYALEQHRRWMDEWLARFETALTGLSSLLTDLPPALGPIEPFSRDG